MIQLIGPGGAGKSTIGALLAERLDVTFLDLDRHLVGRVGDISEYIGRHGYDSYARENVEAYCSMFREGIAVTTSAALRASSWCNRDANTLHDIARSGDRRQRARLSQILDFIVARDEARLKAVAATRTSGSATLKDVEPSA